MNGPKEPVGGTLPSAPLATRSLAESLAAGALAAVLYVALQGDLPFHDAQRFTDQVAGGTFVWDIAHVLLQPTALLLHKASGAGAVITLKYLSSLATAAAIGIFYLLLARLRIVHWQAVLATLILATSCSVITLAPSAHPKLVAFPLINAAFLCLVVAEQQGMRRAPALALCGLLLGLGSGYLVSAMAALPFATLAVLAGARHGGQPWTASIRQAAILGGVCSLTFVFILSAGYVLLTGHGFSFAGLGNSVTAKAALRPPATSLAVDLARFVFGTISNLIFVPRVGPTVGAWMRGQIPSLRGYWSLLPFAILWAAAGIFIAWVYLCAARAIVRYRCLAAGAFLCGAASWAIWYAVNDPEHVFMLTGPTIVLFLLAVQQRAVRIILPAWALAATVVNLFLLAIPVATYPLAASQAKLASMIKPHDLLIQFVQYPGHAYVAYYDMPNVHRLSVDETVLDSSKPCADALKDIDAELGEALQAGNKVFVADILDQQQWDAPWMSLLSHRITKPQIFAALLHDRVAERLPDLSGIKLWQLHQAKAPP